jgi:hypothetical protein
MSSIRAAVRNGFNLALAALILAMGGLVVGCGPQQAPLQVSVTQLGPYAHAAKGPTCQMPVLETLPLKPLSQIAIVEAWADQKDQPPDVLPALQSKACETGADALVIINSEHQDIKNLLYGATPNDTMNDLTAKSAYTESGQYIKTAEHTRRIGEAGHNGFYIDAVAIDYEARNPRRIGDSNAMPSTVIDSIRTPHG